MQHDFILLDRSASMQSKWVEAIGGVNAYVKGLADTKVDTGVTLMTFDTVSIDVIRDRIIPSTWNPVGFAECPPRASTPLNDAVGRIVALAEQGIGGKPYEKVAIIIETDGEENSSSEVTTEQAKALLDKCRQKGWAVVFLGANYDNVAQARGYGAQASMTVNSSVRNSVNTASMMAAKRSTYSIGGQSADAMQFTVDEQGALRSDDVDYAAALVKKNQEAAAKALREAGHGPQTP